eukprot:SM000042S15288  [mRNA]  locus=s42:95441:98522:+ [translate_table: standard]
MGMAGIGGSRPRARLATPAATGPTTATSETRTPDKARSAALRPSQKEALRAFVAAALPFGELQAVAPHGGAGLPRSQRARGTDSPPAAPGSPLDLDPARAAAVRWQGFTSADAPPADQKQPAWKPHLYKGKRLLLPTPCNFERRQRLTIAVREVVTAALYDREEVADMLAVDGVVQCQAAPSGTVVIASSPKHALTAQLDSDADLEGLPDVSLALSPPPGGHLADVTVHACAQAPEPGGGVGGGRDCTLSFAPPLGVFDLARYGCSGGVCARRTLVQGFYQSSTFIMSRDAGTGMAVTQMQMVAVDQGAFLIKVRLLDGFGALAALDHCSFLLPFPLRRVVGLEGTPSTGTSSFSGVVPRSRAYERKSPLDKRGSIIPAEHGVEWKLVTGGRGYVGKPLEASFSGKSPDAKTSNLNVFNPRTVRFADRVLGRAKAGGTGGEEAATAVREDNSCSSSSSSGSEDVEEGNVTASRKVGGGQPRAPQVTTPPAAGWDDSFCWDAYDVARVGTPIAQAKCCDHGHDVSFRLSGQTASGVHVDPKLVSVHPAMTRVPVDIAYEVIAGDYILFSTLGKYPSIANHFQASAP